MSASSLPRISLVMIVRNEERFLDDCLESARDCVDEMVVVDTGSRDRTVEIAESFGARVLHHAWADDFSAARNVSLDAARGDWALWLDADERLAPGSAPLIRRLVETAPARTGGFLVSIGNLLAEDGAGWHRACRLFRRTSEVRFSGRVHEQVLRALCDAGYDYADSDVEIEHRGYLPSIMQERGKHERFVRLLERDIAEATDPCYRAFQQYNLGNAYYARADYAPAVDWFMRAAEHCEPSEEVAPLLSAHHAMALRALGRGSEAAVVCQRAAELGIRHPELEFAGGHLALDARRYEEARRHFERAIEMGCVLPRGMLGDASICGAKARYGLALAAMGKGEFERAVGECRASLIAKPDLADARYLLSIALRCLGRTGEARVELEALLDAYPDHAAAKADLGCVLYDAGELPAALPRLQEAAAVHSDSAELWSRLAGCYEVTGRREEARHACQRAVVAAPCSAPVHAALGRACSALGDHAGALAAFADALNLDPALAEACFGAADALYYLGDYQRAAQTTVAGLERNPACADGFTLLGRCFEALGNPDGAREAYAEATIRRCNAKAA